MSDRAKTILKWVAVHWWVIPIVIIAFKVAALERENVSLRAGGGSAADVASAHLEIANSKHDISVSRAEQAATLVQLATIQRELGDMRTQRTKTDAALVALQGSTAALVARAKTGDPTAGAEIDAKFRALGYNPVPAGRP